MHVLITGASSGIGAALAREYARHGAHLTLVARRREALESLAAECEGRAFVHVADLMRLDACAEVVAAARAAHGPIDVLINNAGVQYVEPALGVSDARAEALFALNVHAPMRLIREVAPAMVERRAGHIINIASMAGLIHTPGMCHYNASKAALAAASESLRAELEPHKVRVMTVYPGPVASEMEASAREAFEGSGAVNLLPTGTPEALAAMIWRAMRRGQARVIYPRAYSMGRYARVMGQWLTERLTPPLR